MLPPIRRRRVIITPLSARHRHADDAAFITLHYAAAAAAISCHAPFAALRGVVSMSMICHAISCEVKNRWRATLLLLLMLIDGDVTPRRYAAARLLICYLPPAMLPMLTLDAAAFITPPAMPPL